MYSRPKPASPGQKNRIFCPNPPCGRTCVPLALPARWRLHFREPGQGRFESVPRTSRSTLTRRLPSEIKAEIKLKKAVQISEPLLHLPGLNPKHKPDVATDSALKTTDHLTRHHTWGLNSELFIGARSLAFMTFSECANTEQFQKECFFLLGLLLLQQAYSNPGRVGTKRERYHCAMLSSP